ncbi:hypothetical protein FRC06_009845 [Ceratobasidium sp. 370]|nr:hypothetical protein FRC06_009845 [Ceratobasidium sp. 370]
MFAAPASSTDKFTLTTTTFGNQSPLARDQANVVNNCWSEGSYELGVEALNAFRTVDKRYPLPPKTNSTFSPRKLQAQTEIPSTDASQLALELLTTLASTTHPEHLTAGLNSYARAPSDAAELDEAQVQVKSPLIDEAVRVGRARDCWQMLREGFLARRDQDTLAKPDEDDEDEGAGQLLCVVAPYAWGVLGWWIELFEVDERVQCMEQGSAAPSKLLLSYIPPASRAGAPRWDVQAPLSVVSSAYRPSLQSLDLPGLGFRLLRLLINTSATFAVAPRILVRATTDQLQTLASSAFKHIVENLLQGRPPFPVYLYSRFCFCLAALYLARTGAGVSELGIFGAASSSRRGPRARPRVSGAFESQAEPQMESQVESQTESQTETIQAKSTYPYPTPSLQTIQALLRSTVKTANTEAFCMHAVARWTILRALVVEMSCEPSETWMPADDLPEWNLGAIESVRVGFSADASAGAGAEGYTLWTLMRDQCELLPL